MKILRKSLVCDLEFVGDYMLSALDKCVSFFCPFLTPASTPRHPNNEIIFSNRSRNAIIHNTKNKDSTTPEWHSEFVMVTP